MKTDLYTKIVLTVIAVALTIGLLKDFDIITPAQASSIPAPATRESANAYQGVIDVNVVKIGGSNVNTTSGALDVNLDRAGGSRFYSSGIPVEVKNIKDLK